MENAGINVSDELKGDISLSESLNNTGHNSINDTDSSTYNNMVFTKVNNLSKIESVNNNELLTRAVWITRLADDNLSLSYSTQELLGAGNSLDKVLDIQVCELIRKYVDEKQIMAVAGNLDIFNLSDGVKDILLRLANASIDSSKNSNNSYSLMTFSKGNLKEVLNLRNPNSTIKDYKDLRQAMLNEWMQIKQEFYNVKS
ncbi:hypothetical protein A7978_04700 (plasmid) [Borrelia turicatae]|uniref:Uncharacterized protein n=2 Tax=Borrelia turicatae TaxID=142 RepID=T1ECN0_BORT9|nr:DUF1357 family protein [Borrelia turicatae]ADN26498.1 hypothetical protein BTA070 [Borrelia turicatae 91E135]ANF34412.1 hypothetical protein A7978_04700 [Borrelia turicatae]UPA13996.1 DUF1357 family protein [Borrelia turicatae 91E135]UPA15489.1 DUF1357 family protein [Borrelia turicatae]